MSGVIIIPCHNRVHFTERCLASVEMYRGDWRVHVVSDASSDSTSQLLGLYGNHSWCSIQVNDTHRGKAKVVNDAIIKWLEMDVERFIFLDSDVKVTNGWLAKLAEPLQIHGVAMSALPLLKVNVEEYMLAIGEGDVQALVGDFVTVGCCMMDRKTIRRVGLWYEEFGKYGYIDREMCARIRALGLYVAYGEPGYAMHMDSAQRRGDASAYANWKTSQRTEYARDVSGRIEALKNGSRCYVPERFADKFEPTSASLVP